MLCSLQLRQGPICQHVAGACTRQRAVVARNWGADERRTPVARPGCAADVVAEPAAGTAFREVVWPAAPGGEQQLCSQQVLQTRAINSQAALTEAHSAVVQQPQQEHHAVIVQLTQGMQQSTAPVFVLQTGDMVERPAAQQQQQHKQRGRRRDKSATAAAGNAPSSGAGPPINKIKSAEAGRECRNSSRRLTQRPVQLAACERGNTLRVASAVSSLLSQGQAVVLPGGTGMQLPRGLAALASARTLLLSGSSSTGLLFQPSFVNNTAATGAAPVGDGSAAGAGAAADQQTMQDSKASSGSKEQGSCSIVLKACRVAEAQLRRHEQNPLIAARYGSASRLAAATVARVCQQGFTAVRAAGPDAVRVAVHAITQARQKLVAHGLDIAVVPVTEFVDVDSLPGQEEQQFVEYGADDSALAEYDDDDNRSKQFVRVTVLHVVRCRPKQPWKLLPQPVPAAEQPAAVWQKRQQHKQSQCLQQHQKPTMEQHPLAAPILQPREVQEVAALHVAQSVLQQEHRALAEQQPLRHQQHQQPLDSKLHEERRQPQYSFDQTVPSSHQEQPVPRDMGWLQAGEAPTTSSPLSGLAHAVALTAANNTVQLLRPLQSAGSQQQHHTSSELSSDCSSISSTDGSIWCQQDDARFGAVYVGEGAACADDGGDADILQSSTACHFSSKHPGQPMLLHKQRQGSSSKRQLVAAAHGQGLVAVSGGVACNS